MAKLIQDNKQMQAFNDINEMLSEVSLLNEVIMSEAPITIDLGKKRSLSIDRSLEDKVVSVLKTQRQRRVKEIRG